MKVIFFVLFLISRAQTISNENEDKSLIQSNVARELNGTISLPFQSSTNLIFHIFVSIFLFYFFNFGIIILLFNDDRNFIWKW